MFDVYGKITISNSDIIGIISLIYTVIPCILNFDISSLISSLLAILFLLIINIHLRKFLLKHLSISIVLFFYYKSKVYGEFKA